MRWFDEAYLTAARLMGTSPLVNRELCFGLTNNLWKGLHLQYLNLLRRETGVHLMNIRNLHREILDEYLDQDLYSSIHFNEAAPRIASAFLAAGGNQLLALNSVAGIVLRPKTEYRDHEGRLHSVSGPALIMQDESQLHFYEGVPVPQEAIEHPSRISCEQILRESNTEIRRALIALKGMESFLKDSHPEVIDSDHDPAGSPRHLYRIQARTGSPIMVLHVIDPSKNGAGRSADVFLEIPPDMQAAKRGARFANLSQDDKRFWRDVKGEIRTCHAATAWTFELTPGEYSPQVET